MLDSYTLLIVFIMISAIFVITLIFNNFSRIRYPGTMAWTIGTLLIVISAFGFAYQKYLPKIIGIVLTNNLAIASFVCYQIGVDRFYGKKDKGLLYWLPIFFTLPVFIILTFVYNNTKLRIIYISFIFAVICFMIIYSIIKSLPKSNRGHFLFPVLGFGLLFLFYLLRFILSFFLPPVKTVSETGIIYPLIFFVSIFNITIISLSLLVITKARFENELMAKNETLNAVNESKDKLFSIISHDLRGPIGATGKVIDMLLSEFTRMPRDELFTILKTLKDSTDNTYSLLNSLLIWSEAQRGVIKFNPEKLLLNNLVSMVLRTVNSLLQIKNITVVNKLEETDRIYTDLSMTETIIRNIISNAIKYSYINGIIEIGYSTENYLVGIYIKDNGCGMSEKIKNSLFKFTKIKSNPGTSGELGNGFGLIISNEFMNAIGGKILVESEDNKGTTFRLLFPAYKE